MSGENPSVCPYCKGKRVIKRGDKWVKCRCETLRDIDRYLKPLKPFNLPPDELNDVLCAIDVGRDLFLKLPLKMAPIKLLRGVVAFLLYKDGFKFSYRLKNIYDLMELYLGKLQTEGYTSLSSWNESILIFYFPFKVIQNKKMEEVLNYVISTRQEINKRTWLISVTETPIPFIHHLCEVYDIKKYAITSETVENLTVTVPERTVKAVKVTTGGLRVK